MLIGNTTYLAFHAQALQEKASNLLRSLVASHVLKKHMTAWSEHVQAVKEERLRKEERRQKALAACHVGLPESPPTAAWQCQQSMQALQVIPAQLHNVT